MDEALDTVYVVDDDAAIRDSLRLLFESVGYAARTFASARAFLDVRDDVAAAPGCLVLDIRMPEMNGIELQQVLTEIGLPIPVVFLTAHADVPTAVDAVRAGAIDFLQKPFREDELLARVGEALDQDRRLRVEAEQRGEVARRIRGLTTREREVLDLVVGGESNKGIARRLGLSRRTVEVHRANLMRKMRVQSVSELVLATVAAGVVSGMPEQPVAEIQRPALRRHGPEP